MKKFYHNKLAMISLSFLIIVAIISIIAPLIAPLPINKQDLLNIKGDMSIENCLVLMLVAEITSVDCYMRVGFLLL